MEITKGIYKRTPVSVNEGQGDVGNPWEIQFRQGLFNMTSDSGLFLTQNQLEESGWSLDGNVYRMSQEKYLPLYEAKLFHQYNHRFNTFESIPLKAYHPKNAWARKP